ncbi:hypothetical protein [Streptomyces sp. NPDC018693]|uniref:hypothetical protein n=1 Tax=unclassified Streptomyces TaxID=2593676 RepID=UPI0037AFBEE0
MTASSQNPPGAQPPETQPTPQAAAAYATFGIAVPAPAGPPTPAPDTTLNLPRVNPAVPQHLRVRAPQPAVPECFTCGTHENALQACPDGRRYDSGAPVLYCPKCVPPPASVRAAEGVLARAMKNGLQTPRELAWAEHDTGVLFDAQRAKEIANGAADQARAEDQAELADLKDQLDEAHRNLAVVGGAQRKLNAVMRLIEGRPGTDHLPAAEIAAAAEYVTTAYDPMPPMTLGWAQAAHVPDPNAADQRTFVECVTAHGARACLVLAPQERLHVALLLGGEAHDQEPCTTDGCGTADYDAADRAPVGWVRIEVAGLGDMPRWYCTPRCAETAIARAGQQLAADDRAAAVDPHQQAAGGAW